MINSWNCVSYIKWDHTLYTNNYGTQSCTWQPPKGVLDNGYTSLTETFVTSAEIILASCVVLSQSDKQLTGGHSYIMHYCNKHYLFQFHSLEGNGIGDSGASALGDALRVNQNLKILK